MSDIRKWTLFHSVSFNKMQEMDNNVLTIIIGYGCCCSASKLFVFDNLMSSKEQKRAEYIRRHLIYNIETKLHCHVYVCENECLVC